MAYNAFPSFNYQNYPANSYQQQYSQAVSQGPYMGQANNSYAVQQQPVGIVWVDGEVGAKAYQLPANWPVNAPMPLWDTNDTIIYLKSTNQMGMPNPIQKVRYTMEEQPKLSAAMSGQAVLPSGEQSGHHMPDMSQYVRKDEMEQMKEELKAAISSAGNSKEARSSGKSSV